MFGKKNDWKDSLNDDAKEILVEILESARKHRCAYSSSDDVKVAQLWTALIEMKREMNEISCLLKKVQAPFKTIVEIGEKEKEKTIERIVSDILRPADEQTQEATKKLVESLMKF